MGGGQRSPAAAGTREFGLDLVRAVAAAQVVAVHFFLNNGFYDVPYQGVGMLISGWVRMLLMTCVPLFLVLTGYLCVQRTWSPGYYGKLLPVLLAYLVAGGFCLAYQGVFLEVPLTVRSVIRQVLDFSAVPYGWYVEMYIGLFLLSPFVNAAWKALEGRGQLALLLTLMGLTALPAGLNVLGQIVPDWWSSFYPLTYYVLGAWLKEHPVKVRRGLLLAGWVGLALAVALIRYLVDGGRPFGWAAISDWASGFILGETVCLFTLLRRPTGTSCPRGVVGYVRWLARLALPTYMMSYITDQIIYPPLLEAVGPVAQRLWFFPVMAAVSLACSGVLGQGVDWVVQGLVRLAPRRLAGGRP